MHPEEVSLIEGKCAANVESQMVKPLKIDTHATKGSQPKTKIVTNMFVQWTVNSVPKEMF
jgi:hypothetical protein